MLIKLLYLVLAFVLFRFLFRLARALIQSTRGPEIHARRRRDDDPARDQRVVDVEFTEEREEDTRT
jgi:hypothetical protein